MAFAGLGHAIDIRIGHSDDVLPQLQAKAGTGFRAVFFDQRGSRYDRDLQSLEKLNPDLEIGDNFYG